MVRDLGSEFAAPAPELGDHDLEVLHLLHDDGAHLVDEAREVRVLAHEGLAAGGGLELAVGVVAEQREGIALDLLDPRRGGRGHQAQPHRPQPSREAPGRQVTSPSPESWLTRRDSTNRRSDSRLR